MSIIGGVSLLLLTASGQIQSLIAAAWLAASVLAAVYYLRRYVMLLQLRGDQVNWTLR